MITDADITKLKGTFATKKDLTTAQEDIADIKVELGEVHDTIDTMAAAIVRMENRLDGIAGSIQDQRTENGAGAVHLARHDRKIEALAFGTGIKIPA